MLLRSALIVLPFLLRKLAAGLPAATPEWLQGKRMIVGTIKYPPYINYERDSTGKLFHLDGCAHQIVDYLAQKFHFTYEYIQEPNNNYGFRIPFNNTWTGLPAMLMKGEIDIAATGLSATYPRSQVMDFTQAFLDDPIPLLIPYPTADSKVGAITRPFQKEVWAMIVVGILISSFVLCFLARFRVSCIAPEVNRRDGRDDSELKYDLTFLFVAGILVNQPRYYRLLGPQTAAVVTAWCLAAIVIVNAYTTSITAFIMAPKYTPAISSMEDLINNPQGYRFSARQNSISWEAVMYAEEGTRAKIGALLRRHPEDAYPNTNRSFSFVQETIVRKKKAIPYERSVALTEIWNILKTTGTCPLYISAANLETSRSSLGLPKNSPLTPLFNGQIIWLRDTGILDYLERKYRPPTNRCTAPLSLMGRSSSVVRLALGYLLGVFLLYIIGTSASIVVFVVELIVGRLQSNHV